MATFVKINNAEYPADVLGRLKDGEWNDRHSKALKIQMSYAEACELFVNDVDWSIVLRDEEVTYNENEEGEQIEIIEERVEEHDQSEFSVAGEIIDHRNGYITVKMGTPTAEELLDMIKEGLAQ